MSSSKRKSSDNHYENHDDNNDNYDEDNDYIMTDIISTKQITRDYTHKKMKKYNSVFMVN